MCETDKPFACNISECGMRFTNEDHLTVHQRKHDMCLTIGGQKSNIFVADQTPTPTRFIRNCEEVGLFQDLQNVNPFEEQFRKATEAVKSGATLHTDVDTLCGEPVDDTLHTPQVYPNIVASSLTREPISPSIATSVITSLNSPKDALKLNNNTLLDTPSPSFKDPTNLQLVLRLNKSSNLSPNIDNNNAPILNTPTVIVEEPMSPSGNVNRTVLLYGSSMKQPPIVPSSELVKKKLKETLTSSKTVSSTTNAKVPIPANSKSLLVPITKPKLLGGQEKLIIKRPATSSALSILPDDDVKRQKFLERNRAAASRCRQKRKNWITNLEHKCASYQHKIFNLTNENTSLRKEVMELKKLLLAHKNCDVTKSMCQNGVIHCIESNNDRTSTGSVIRVVPANTNNIKTKEIITCVSDKPQAYVITPLILPSTATTSHTNDNKEIISTVIVKNTIT